MKPLKEKKPFQAPHTFVILVVLILLAVAATYVVPAGEYTRYTDEATNRTLVEAGSFHYVESHPVSFLTVPALIYRAIVKAASTVTFILIIGGSFEIITSTGILTVLCKKMAKAFRGREYFVIPAFLLLFSVFGTTMGMSAEVMIFVPIGIALAASPSVVPANGIMIPRIIFPIFSIVFVSFDPRRPSGPRRGSRNLPSISYAVSN